MLAFKRFNLCHHINDKIFFGIVEYVRGIIIEGVRHMGMVEAFFNVYLSDVWLILPNFLVTFCLINTADRKDILEFLHLTFDGLISNASS